MYKSAIVSILLLFLTAVPTVYGVEPAFLSCNAPVGDIQAQYDSGVHGIVGSSNSFTGSDVVYRVDENSLLQCFCPDDGGDGVQTNWLKADGLSEQDKADLLADGWIVVPNGANWGLDEGVYLAKNITWECNAGTGGGDLLGAAASTMIEKVSDFPDILGLSATHSDWVSPFVRLLGLLFIVFGLFRIRKISSE